jgi:serine/threonine protein kinase/Tol biopolymer transport system component
LQSQTEPKSDSVSHFRIVERLGRGGMGVVYKAVDLRLERTVALKFLSAESGAGEEGRRRFLREARAASALDHPNICTLYEIGETDEGQLFLAMAFCEGETLAQRLARGPLRLATAIELAVQVAAGLEAAHEKGIVHRDIKPSNLIVAPGGALKIVDFGIARRADQTLLTHAGMALGTTVYMSPEQLRGEDVDRRTDLWALGVVLYQMVTGEVPFDGSEPEMVSAILGRSPRPMGALRPKVPEALERIVARALAKPRAQRYGSAAEMRAELAAVVVPEEVSGAELEETLIEVSWPPSSPPESPEEEAALTGLRLGSLVAQFRILSPLGGGGMGVVYRAEDRRLGRTVALKFLALERTRDPAAKERFLQEARAASALDHPNLCTVHEVGETPEGRLYLTMPCYDGETLAQRIAAGPLPVEEALDLALQTARGLAKAHRNGIVHRDIKPANLIETGDGILKILDFGIAKLAEDPAVAAAGAPGSGGGGLAGTPSYMSPEQVRSERVGPATDVWSLGVVLYEMLAGVRPFGGESRAAVFRAIREDTPEPLSRQRPEVPAELERLVSRMLAKDPAARHPTAAEAFADLEALVGARITGTGGTGGIPVTRGSRISMGIFLVLLALAGVGLWLGWRGMRLSPAPIQATFTPLTDQEGSESFPSLAPDGHSFLYAKSVAGRSHLFLQRVGEGNPRDLSPAGADDTQPAFSPDGRQLAFRSERDGGGIFLEDLTGGAARRLADFGYNPAWSPDGRAIAVATEGISNPAQRQTRSRIWVVEIATGAKRQVETGDAVQPSWSPHGRRLAYWGVPLGTGQRFLWTVPLDGGKPERVLGDPHLNWNPVWSPDGRYLYFASDRSGSMNLWRTPIDEASGQIRGELEPITTPAQWSGELSLSRDGRRILYATNDGRSNLERVVFDPLTGEVGGSPQPVTQGSRTVRSADLSPDGQWIVFDTSAPQEDLFVVGASGGEVRQLTNDAFKDRSPRWAPDGSRIVFYSNRGGTYGLWTIRPDGSAPAPIRVPGQGPFYLPVWSPEGGRLVCLHGNATVVIDLARPGAHPVPLAGPAADFTPADWSPDGAWLTGYDGAGIGLYSFAGRRFTRLVATGHSPVWLRDSRRLLYLDGGRLFMADRATKAVREVMAPPAGSTFAKLAVRGDDGALYLVRTVEEGDIWMLNLR